MLITCLTEQLRGMIPGADEGSEHRYFLLRVLGASAQSPCLFSTKSFHLPLEFLQNPPLSVSPSWTVCP